MLEMSPCKGCTNRSPTCHGSCEEYKAWRDRYQAQQKHLADNRNRWGVPMTAAREKAYENHQLYGASIRRKGTDL